MINDEGMPTSVQQDEWVEICEAIRVELKKRAQLANVMDIMTLCTFINACQQAQYLELISCNYDAKANNPFGGMQP